MVVEVFYGLLIIPSTSWNTVLTHIIIVVGSTVVGCKEEEIVAFTYLFIKHLKEPC